MVSKETLVALKSEENDENVKKFKELELKIDKELLADYSGFHEISVIQNGRRSVTAYVRNELIEKYSKGGWKVDIEYNSYHETYKITLY